MNCNYHQDSRIELICVASHKCQRKLCSQCEHQEEYSTHDARLFEQFHKSLLKQLDESNLEEKNDFKQDLSDIESMLQKIKEELSKIIAEICYNIDQKNEYYLNVTNETTNLAEQSYVKLEELLEIHQGTLLDDWKCEKQFYLGQMKDMIQFSQKEITTLSERLNQKIICFREFQKIGQKCFVWKEDLYEVLALTKDINSNDEIFNVILQSIKKQDKTPLDYCFFNSIKKKFKEEINFYNHDLTEIQKQTKLKNKNNDIQIIAHVIKNIRELEFYKMNYSLQDFQETRKILIQQIENDEKIMKFLIFLVKLTSFDEKFIQCGSNSLNLLVEMKADLRGQCFNNIRIQDTLLIRANFARCNLSNSQFINVNISGINVNQAQLIGCKWRNLKINELIKLQGHKNSIQSVCFSPDGKTLASASDDKSIILWDVKTVQQIAKLNGHSNPVRSVCFSHDGATLASGSGYPIYNFENDSDDYSIRLWDVKTGQQKAKLNGHCNCVYQVCFSPNRRILASCSDDRTIRLWDIEKQKQIAKLEGHYNGVQSVSFSPDGSNLASGSYDKSVRLWDPRTGQQKAILNGHQDDVMSVCFSPDGTTLASASKDKSVRLWDVKTGEQKAKLDGHSSYVMSVNFSSDGATLASGSRDHSIRLWDVKTGQQTVNLEASSIRSVCFSPDGLILASGSYDNSISLWDVRVAQENAKVDGHRNIFQQVCFSSDGNKLYSCSDDKTIRFWDVKKGQQISKLNGLNQNFQFICFPSNGNTIAYICDDHSINLKDVQTEQLIAKLNDYNGTVLSVSFCNKSSKLASGSDDNSISIWDVKKKKLIAKLIGHSNAVHSVCFSPDGKTLASASNDKSIILWDVNTVQQIAKLIGHSNVGSICFSPDSTTLASSNGCPQFSFEKDSDDYSISLWDAQTGQQKAKLYGHSDRVKALCFSPDGIVLASGSSDSSIRLWNVKTGQQKAKLDGHYDKILSVCFSPDGATLASSSVDHSIRLWDVSTGKEFKKFFERYETILCQFKSQLQKNLNLKDVLSIVPTVRISQNPNLEANAALISRGEFVNYSGVNLRQLFLSKGSFILESAQENCNVQ